MLSKSKTRQKSEEKMSKIIGISMANEVVETHIPIRFAYDGTRISVKYWSTSSLIQIRHA